MAQALVAYMRVVEGKKRHHASWQYNASRFKTLTVASYMLTIRFKCFPVAIFLFFAFICILSN